MILLKEVLNNEAAAKLVEMLSKREFTDGKLTAKGHAVERKNNLQMRPDGDGDRELETIVIDALNANPVFNQATIPMLIMEPMFSRYDAGMAYGIHLDAPFMRAGNQGITIRTDLSVTVFLNDPGSYEGGELVIETNAGDVALKLDPGDAVIYYSGTRHRVNPVTSGQRLVAVTWVQSRVRDPLKRELLYDLSRAQDLMRDRKPPPLELELIEKAYVNLLRMWGEA